MGRQVEPGGGGVPVAGSIRGRAICAFVGGEGVSVACGRSAVGEVLAFKRHVERLARKVKCLFSSGTLSDSRKLPAMPFFCPVLLFTQLGVQTPPTRNTKP